MKPSSTAEQPLFVVYVLRQARYTLTNSPSSWAARQVPHMLPLPGENRLEERDDEEHPQQSR